MKKVKDREQAIKQLELVFQGKGGHVENVHIPVLARVYHKLKADEEISVDDFIILAVYRDTVRRVHLQALNKDHPCHQKRKYKGQHIKKRSPEHAAKLSAAAKLRWKKAKANGQYANGKKPKAD